MHKPTVSDADITRLREDRDAADAAYNEALTALDRALVALGLPELPGAVPAADTSRLPSLNDLWQVVPANPVPFAGWRARIAGLAWRVLAPVAQRQQEFNSALVDHLNRTAASAEVRREAVATALASLREPFSRLAAFHARLIQYLQQVTLYVDTKDRLEAGYLRQQLEERTLALAAGLDGVSDELLKRWESAVSREQRYATRVTTVAASVEELRLSLSSLKYAGQALQRELERLAQAAPLPPAAAAEPGVAPAAAPRSLQPATGLADRIDAGKYVGFEDAFRGSPDDIRAKQESYLPLFEGASDVLDIGCGRGEFLELLASRGVVARGVDINPEMAAGCRERGLDVTDGDALGYLSALPDESLGGIIALQVVEHLEPDALLRLLALAQRKLRPRAAIVLETVNAACWFAFFASYIRDITHVRPLHPETLRYLLVASGFEDVTLRFSAPYPEQNKLQRVTLPPAQLTPALGELQETFNENFEKINALLFTYLDYAVVGRTPARV